MFWSILHRTILFELVKVFLLSLIGIMGILVMAGIVAEASQKGLTPSQVMLAIPLLIPSMLPWTIPATTLFATSVVYGRLSHDNEILAMKAAGINLMKVIWPGIVLGLTMSAVTLSLYYRTIPYTHHLLRNLAIRNAKAYLYAMLKRERCIRQPVYPWVMFVSQVQGNRLRDFLFRRLDANKNYDVTARAHEAEIEVDVASRHLVVYMRHGVVLGEKGRENSYFVNKEWDVELPPDLATDKKNRSNDMTWQELLSSQRELVAEREARAEEIAGKEQRLAQGRNDELEADVTNLKSKNRHLQLEINSLRTELQMRPALSLGCLCFVLVGCPVGIWFSRSDYLSAFITCFLPIVFIYYPLMLCTSNFARQGQMHPALAVWIADGVTCVIAAVLFWRLLKN